MQLVEMNRRIERDKESGTADDFVIRPLPKNNAVRKAIFMLLCVTLLSCQLATLAAQNRVIPVTQRYLNVPIGRLAGARVFTLSTKGAVQRELPLQLAEDSVDYWIFLDVTEFKGQTITLSGPASQSAFDRIYQAGEIHGAATLYRENNRPQFHFTVKRGWSNDVNGPIFYEGQYHLFWQAFPFGVAWNTGYMYWGHAVSRDMIHWRELPSAMRVDKLGSPWSGSSLVDHQNSGGWGKDALVLAYTAYDHVSEKEIQCIAYSKDKGQTFTRFEGNPVIDSNAEAGTNQTRDPKVFWYAPARHWVMVLFEKDGMSFFSSLDLKTWTRKSHLKGLYECPDLFDLPVDGDANHTKWVLHGGSSDYFIGNFNGETFNPESPLLHYAEGKNAKGDDVLYAAQSFAEMPDHRRVQLAWGRIEEKDMPFTQMMLFPTEFKLTTTRDGLRLLASPIKEIDELHSKKYSWSSLTSIEANQRLALVPAGPLQVKMHVTLKQNTPFTIRYQGNDLATITPNELENGHGSIEVLLDKCVAEVFVDGGRRYITKETLATSAAGGLEIKSDATASILDHLEVYELKSMWKQ